MKYEISQEKLNHLGSVVLDDIYGPLHTERDDNRYFDDNGKGRIHVRKNTPHILFKDYQKMVSAIDVDTDVWGHIIQHWMEERYGRKLFDEFAWLSYEI